MAKKGVTLFPAMEGFENLVASLQWNCRRDPEG